MITFSNLQMDPHQPVYQQLAAHVKRQILLGNAQDGDVLPSRREIAVQANVNPNTVQKACKLMEEEGYVATDGNRLSTIRITDELFAKIRDELTLGLVRRFVEEARQNHLSYKHTIALISELWEDE